MDSLYDVAIVGGGPGGYSAALYCARAGLKTVILEKMTPGGQMATTPLVENYPGFEEGIGGFELAEKMQRGAEKAGAVTEFAEVTGLDLRSQPKKIATTEGDFEAHAVILSTGAAPKELGLDGEAELRGRGVAYCANCEGMFYKNKVTAVVGGGNSAAEEAMTLSKLCKKVYIVHRRDTMRATASYMAPLQKAENIEFIWNARIDAILYDKTLKGLRITDKVVGNTFDLPIDGLFIAIGRSPDTALVSGQLELDGTGYIAADETTKTSLPGVFAVGDVRTKPLRQIVTAAADGAAASKFAEEYIALLPR